jgi:membrane-associated phospholipid phosphatase
MALITIKPTAADKFIANSIAAHTRPPVEKTVQLLTWGADEKLLLALAAAAWLYAAPRPSLRPYADHFLCLSLLSAILPHIMKDAVNQTRPDRLSVRGHWRGIPLSGRARDAFPSGHAVHMGALASAADLFPPTQRRVVQALALALSATRILLLAHWTSDVIAGFALGGLLERVLRHFTLGK